MFRTMWSWTGAAALVLGATVAAALLSSAAAAADPVGTLTVDPLAGKDLQVPKVHLSAGCPVSSDGYDAVFTGPGAFATGFLITPTQDPNFSTTEGFDVQLGESFVDVATDLNTVLVPGDYVVTVNCLDTFTQEIKGQFAGKIIFTSATDWVSDPGASPSGSPSTSPAPSTSPSTSPAPSASASESPSSSATPSHGPEPTASESATPSQSAAATLTPALASTPAATGTLPVTGPPAAGIALLGLGSVLLGTLTFAVSGRRRRVARW